uniref:Matrix-remodelling associated 8b n=1 Tax=Erpetoichthys calabaricus TaxID=27687 RepID=A0A8C4RW83_ERPCA
MLVWDQGSGDSTAVAVYNISAPAGSQTVLQCQSQRMVWTQDRLHDRQRVVHWDLYSTGRDYKVERLLDMFSAGDQRIYNSYNQGRMSMISTAFADGNFSLIIKDVAPSDKGIYSCNLHHHYCHLYESTKMQLNITKSERRYWDGDKVVVMALVGSTVLLPCVNRRQVWTERNSEEEQQVVHWDRQPPGVWHDRADRLIDLYASGERRSYGPLFIRQKMNISEAIYSCHLHHHYCGLHERRVFLLGIGPPCHQKPDKCHPDGSCNPVGSVLQVHFFGFTSRTLHLYGSTFAPSCQMWPDQSSVFNRCRIVSFCNDGSGFMWFWQS